MAKLSRVCEYMIFDTNAPKHQHRNDCKNEGPSTCCSIIIIILSISWGHVTAKIGGDQCPPGPLLLTPML